MPSRRRGRSASIAAVHAAERRSACGPRLASGSWMHRQCGLTVATTADPQANPAREDVRFLLFEAVRELLFNAVKHAAVDSVELTLALDRDERVPHYRV